MTKFDKAPIKNLPGTETFRKTEEYLRSPLGQKHEKEQREKEERIKLANSVRDSFIANAQKQQADKKSRHEKQIALTERLLEETRQSRQSAESTVTEQQKGHKLAWLSIRIGVIGIVATVVFAVIVSETFRNWLFTLFL